MNRLTLKLILIFESIKEFDERGKISTTFSILLKNNVCIIKITANKTTYINDELKKNSLLQLKIPKNMKKIHFKNKMLLLVLMVIPTLGVKAQWCSTLPSQSSQNQASSQSTNCVRRLLDDMIQTSNDRTIDVNVNFWVFTPTYISSLTAVWTHSLSPTTSLSALACLAYANSVFTNVPSAPKLTVPGMTVGVPYPKIRLVLKNFTYVHNDLPYLSVGTAINGVFGNAWMDPKAINVFLGTETTTNVATSSSGTYIASNYVGGIIAAEGNPATPGIDNILRFNPEFYFTLLPDGTRYDNIQYYGKELVHEVGHILGLNHPTGPIGTNTNICQGEPYSSISPTFGCCSYQSINDHAMETYTCSTTSPTATSANILVTQQGCTVQGASDNLMSQNSGCYRYLSPQQIAVMHYNLRTLQTSFLSTSGYTAALNVNPAFNYDVTSNETWTTDRYIKGNIRVKADKTLTIKCGVAMTRYSRIIVEPGAQLIIDGGTITNISGLLWDGIFVMGNPYQPQLIANTNNAGSVLYQGMLRIKNGGTISQASVGVRNYLSNTGNSGGVIFAQNANFINNVMDVQMSGQYMSNFTPIPSASWFYNCNFKTTGVIGANIAPTNHVYLLNVSGVKFMGCTFQCTVSPISSPGNGIYSVDAIYTVDKNGTTPCLFENLNKGIYVNNINPLKTPVISNSKFTNNSYGGYFMNSHYLNFQTNTVTCITSPAISDVYLNNCKYYKIKNNQFSQSTSYTAAGEGVSVYKSKIGAHEVYRNTFSNLYVGINCMDDNGNPTSSTDGLKMNCNDFHITPNSYDVVLSYSSGLAFPLVNKTQGEINTSANATNLVRNIYGATCGNQNKWQIYSGSTVTINHGSNTNTLTTVTQPTASGCKSSYLNVVDKSIPLNYPLHCTTSPPSSGGSSTLSPNRLSAMNDYISDLMDQRAIVLVGGGVPDDFELQSTVASKLNLFLTDSITNNLDSITSVLENNQGYMEDADIQTIFAYMHKGDFATALDKTSLLKEGRGDWKNLLVQLISFLPDTVNGLDSISGQYAEFFRDYALSSDMDGKAVAQALLKAASVSEYNEPHALPEGVSSARMMHPQSPENTAENLENDLNIQVFPNPAKTGINVNYISKEEGIVKIELKDLLGKVIYTNFITSSTVSQYISLAGLKNGMYLISFSKDKKLLYNTKIIKED